MSIRTLSFDGIVVGGGGAPAGALEVRYSVFERAAFEAACGGPRSCRLAPVAEGSATAAPESDYTVKVCITPLPRALARRPR